MTMILMMMTMILMMMTMMMMMMMMLLIMGCSHDTGDGGGGCGDENGQ